jgi:S-adenosylmethionine hydrolase
MRIAFTLILIAILSSCEERKTLVFQSDFGLKDGAVAAMKGVACSVSDNLQIYDLTHEIAALNITEAAYRLNQAAGYWPKGTVFVSIVDPGVGSDRKSIVMKTKTGYYFVTPDNGTLTLIAESMGIEAVREIDETKNRLQGSNASYTFHGRDVYAYTGARLASGVISFEEVGNLLEGEIVKLPGLQPDQFGDGILGAIPVLDIQYGNVWTNIDQQILTTIDVKAGDSVSVDITYNEELKYSNILYFGNTFSDVQVGGDVVYLNSLLNLSVAINQGNFAQKYGISSGEGWAVIVSKVKK